MVNFSVTDLIVDQNVESFERVSKMDNGVVPVQPVDVAYGWVD